MSNSTNKGTIVVFSQSPDERDYIRRCLVGEGFTAVCFEMETICFDNLASIQPVCIIAKTDSMATAWRFVFALNRFWQECSLILVTDVLHNYQLRSQTPHSSIYCLSNRAFNNGIAKTIKQLISKKNQKVDIQKPLIIGQSKQIQNIRKTVPIIESSADPILITGEPGTGKELIARAIALHSRKERIFIKIDCEALQPGMVVRSLESSELFSADCKKTGIILINKLHRLKKSLQAEILLVIDRALDCLKNNSHSRSTHIRLISTASNSIEAMVDKDEFRKDLYYRLKVIPVLVPPLRERKEDISLFIDFFILEACAKLKKSVLIPSDYIREILCAYHWPANVSELKRIMHRIALTGDESCVFANIRVPKTKKTRRGLNPLSFEMDALPSSLEIHKYLPSLNNFSLRDICNEFVGRTEKKLMKKALLSTSWNRKKAAGLLNISYKSLLNKIKIYEIY